MTGTALGGIAEASQPALCAHPECSTAWYRLSVPNRSTTEVYLRAGWVGGRGFPGFTANPQRTFGPSWSVRLLAAPRSVGPAVFLGSPPTHHPIYLLKHIAKDLRATMSSAKMATQPKSSLRPTRDRQQHSTTPTNRAHQQRAALPMQVNHSVVSPCMVCRCALCDVQSDRPR